MPPLPRLFPRFAALSLALVLGAGLNALSAAEPAAAAKSAKRQFAVTPLPNPRAIAVDAANNLYVVDIELAAVTKLTAAGLPSKLDTTGIPGPFAVATHASGDLYLTDADNNTVYKFPGGKTPTPLASGGGPGGFNILTSLAVDKEGNVFVTDNGNAAIRKITPKGVVSVFAGKIGETGAQDGPGAQARFMTPRGIAIDPAGNLHVADEGNSNIRKITPAGEVSTLAGRAGAPGSADGTGTAAQFAAPRALAVDAAGNVYVADTDNQTIRKITPAGVVSTLAGSAGDSGSNDGPGANARFAEPRGIAVDAAGNVYVADTGNACVRQITPTGQVSTIAAAEAR